MIFFRIVFILFFAGMSAVYAEASGLGESLLLEGRLALLRGEKWVLNCQNPDGSWQQDPVLTAQAGMLLANSDAEYYAEHLQKAVRWILNNEKKLKSAGDFAQALRLPLRLNHLELGKLVQSFRQQKSSWGLAAESVISRQWLLEAHFLLPQEMALLSAVEVQEFQQFFLRERNRHPALALLTLLSQGSAQVKPSELESLRFACIEQAAGAEPDMLFWIVRTLRASERFLPLKEKNWRNAIVSRILEKQRGQGAFGGDDSTADLSATVFYLQIMQLCLTQ